MFLSGIDIGGTSIKFGIFDEQLNLLQQWSRPTPKEPAEAAAQIAAQLEPYHVAAIGAGAPGTLNAARETITADNLAWVDVPLAALLRRASGLPAVVINDGHAAMLAEMRSGALQNVQTGILLTLGTGIGGGIVINGQCWRSPTGLAPELGHIITHSDGLPCPCGQCGCFEQYASATALIRMAGGESPADLIARARSGNAAAQAVFAQYVHELCTGIVSLNSIFAPEVVALGGGISEAGHFLLDACHTTLARLHANPQPTLRLAAHRNTAGIIGGAIASLKLGQHRTIPA